ncbi:MAG: zf-HC2 domain-containing protein [Pseudonocardiales bacterium]|nr:zf-HC2 domain-containing protein [Pseudonocardiales bacterium]
MTELTCRQCRELAAELALGVLPGAERARTLAHLDHCTACRTAVSALTRTGEALIELLPAAEPPAGFEHRMMTALGPPPRTRHWLMPTAAIIVAIALAGGGWTLGRATLGVGPLETGAAWQTVAFAPLKVGEQQVGQVYLFPGRPAWIYLSLDTDRNSATGTVRCELVRQDGTTVPVGTFQLAKGYGAWGASVPVDRNSLATARVIDSTGAILATAHFAN